MKHNTVLDLEGNSRFNFLFENDDREDPGMGQRLVCMWLCEPIGVRQCIKDKIWKTLDDDYYEIEPKLIKVIRGLCK